METTDEWTIRSAEEDLEILYEEWESDFAYIEEFECHTIPICLECGNVLNRWTNYHDPSLLFCGVCH